MGSLVKASLCVWIIVDAAAFSASLPEITDEKFIEECVRGHNRARSSVRPTGGDMLYMVGWINISFTSNQMMSAKTKAGRKKQAFYSHVQYDEGRRVIIASTCCLCSVTVDGMIDTLCIILWNYETTFLK